jgi:hypothetical protein
MSQKCQRRTSHAREMPRIVRLVGGAGRVCRGPEIGTPYGITYTYFAIVASSMSPHLNPKRCEAKIRLAVARVGVLF